MRRRRIRITLRGCLTKVRAKAMGRRVNVAPAVLAMGLAACGGGDAAEQTDAPTLPVDAEDHLPDDIYSVRQRAEAWLDSVSVERTTLLKTVAAGRGAMDAYVAGEDARGNRFAADGTVVDLIEECTLLTEQFVAETLPETEELLIALDRDQVGLERFSLRFQRFDNAWIAVNDCWKGLWADETFNAWRARFTAQRDTVVAEDAARRAAAARRRRAQAAAEQARQECIADRDSGFRVQRVGDNIVGFDVMDGDNIVVKFRRARNTATWKFAGFGPGAPDWIDKAAWEARTFRSSQRATGRHAPLASILAGEYARAGNPGCDS